MLKTLSTKFSLFIASMLFSVLVFAQDKKVDITIGEKTSTSTSNVFTQPWVWVVGAAVFIIILVAIIRGGGNRN